VSKHMIAMGKDAPNFNLCNVSVGHTNLFCADTKGVPRVQMPQLDHEQTKAFEERLGEKGYTTEKTEERTDHLRPTQNELDGKKVAAIAHHLRDHPDDTKRIIVSQDNYILDGHHHWAAQIGLDALDNKLGGVMTKVTRVNIGIIDLLREAEAFTGGKGHKKIGDAGVASEEEKPPQD
jgi:hypothetical protein